VPDRRPLDVITDDEIWEDDNAGDGYLSPQAFTQVLAGRASFRITAPAVNRPSTPPRPQWRQQLLSLEQSLSSSHWKCWFGPDQRFLTTVPCGRHNDAITSPDETAKPY